MKAASLLFLLLVTAGTLFAADDVRSKVVAAKEEKQLSTRIDPDKDIYGIPFGTTEEQFIAAHGKPSGYIRLNGGETAMIYGQSHAFLFEGGKLSGVRITFNILDWKLTNGSMAPSRFDGFKWRLTNGIEGEMSLNEVKKILGAAKLSVDRYQYHFTTGKARVELEFSHHTQEGEKDDAYRVHGLLLRLK